VRPRVADVRELGAAHLQPGEQGRHVVDGSGHERAHLRTAAQHLHAVRGGGVAEADAPGPADRLADGAAVPGRHAVVPGAAGAAALVIQQPDERYRSTRPTTPVETGDVASAFTVRSAVSAVARGSTAPAHQPGRRRTGAAVIRCPQVGATRPPCTLTLRGASRPRVRCRRVRPAVSHMGVLST